MTKPLYRIGDIVNFTTKHDEELSGVILSKTSGRFVIKSGIDTHDGITIEQIKSLTKAAP